MNPVLLAATVHDYQHRIAALTLPDSNDRHVLAAAIEAAATSIVTFNLKDFPARELARFGVAAIGPDTFLTGLFNDDPEGIAGVVEAARSNFSQTAPSRSAFLDILECQRLPSFVKCLREGL